MAMFELSNWVMIRCHAAEARLLYDRILLIAGHVVKDSAIHTCVTFFLSASKKATIKQIS